MAIWDEDKSSGLMGAMDPATFTADSKKCPNCGANLYFDVEHNALMCGSCGGVFDPETLDNTGSFALSNPEKDYDGKIEMSEDDKKALIETFKNALPKLDKIEFNVEPQALGETSAPVIMTQSEYMRRMKDMSRLQPGMAFYGDMPTMLNLVLNTDHPLIKENIKDAKPEVVSQLIDLALLQNGLLRGEALNKFVKRSIELI